MTVLLTIFSLLWSMVNPHNQPQSHLVSPKVPCWVHYSLQFTLTISLMYSSVMVLYSIALYADAVMLFPIINSSGDFCAVRGDIDKINDWSMINSLALNREKCKYMTVSCRRAPSVPLDLLPLLVETALWNRWIHLDISVSYYGAISPGGGTYPSYLF